MSYNNSRTTGFDKILSKQLHKRLWMRVLSGLVVTSLLIGIIFTSLLYHSQAEKLKTVLLFETQLMSVSLNSELSHYRSLAVQITSRSRIRQQLEQYQSGEIDLDNLVSSTAPKLADALRLDPDMIGISRMAADGQLLVQVGEAVPATFWPRDFSGESVQFGVPMEINGHRFMVISAPIVNREGKRVGTDLVTFDARRINEIIQNFIQQRYGNGNIRLAVSTAEGMKYFFMTGKTFSAPTESVITSEVHEALHNIEENIHRLVFDGDETIMVHQRLDVSNWVFLFYEKAGSFFMPAITDAAYIGISVAILTLIGIILTRFMVRPLAGRISVEADSLRHLLQSREELLDKVQLSEERFELAMLASSDGLWDWNLKTNQVYYSPRWKSMLGYEDHELENQFTTWESLVDPDDREQTLAIVEECIAGKREGFSVNNRMRHKDGHRVYILARGILVRDDKQQPVRMVGTHVDITEQKRLEQRLRDSEEQSKLIINTAPDAIIVVNSRGEMIRSNPRVEKLFGYRHTEIHGKNVEMLIPDRLRDEHVILRQTYMENPEFRDVRSHGKNSALMGLSKDGTEFPIEASLSPVVINNEQHFVVMVKNISDRIAAESELRASETRFRSIFEGAQDGILVADIETRQFIDANPTMCKMLGYTRDEILKLGVFDLHPAADLPYVLDTFEKQARGELVLAEAIPMLRKDGTAFKADINTSRLEYSGQICLAGFFRDISERKKVEDELKAYRENLEHLVNKRTNELRANQQQLDTILENLPLVFFIKDAAGRHLLVNRCYEQASGISKEQIIGRTDHEIFPAGTADTFIDRDQQVLTANASVTFEEHFTHPDGTEHDYLTTKVPLLDEQGQTYALFGLASDITQSKKLQQELLQAKNEAEHLARIKSDFLSNMSHEIRTPLNGVLGLSRMGQQTDSLTRATALFTRITHSGEHLLQVVNDILDFSRIEAGKMTLEDQPVELYSMVNEVVSLVEKEADDKGLNISVEFMPGLPGRVTGDPLRLRQVLLNLLSNAVKFTEYGEIKLVTYIEQELVHFRISDTGIGMTEAQLEQLFRPFEQADSSTTRRFGGAGLGLSISYSLVKMMAGDILVTSEPGNGSEFVVILPLRESKSEPSSATPDLAAGRQRLRDVRILAAEDVEVNRLVLGDILDNEGATIIFTENGQQALDVLQEKGASAFDVVLMDIQMPVMDGYNATQRIREIAPQLPVIGLTAHAMTEAKQRCLDVGMVDHVSKPIDIDILVASILRHASKP